MLWSMACAMLVRSSWQSRETLRAPRSRNSRFVVGYARRNFEPIADTVSRRTVARRNYDSARTLANISHLAQRQLQVVAVLEVLERPSGSITERSGFDSTVGCLVPVTGDRQQLWPSVLPGGLVVAGPGRSIGEHQRQESVTLDLGLWSHRSE